MGAIYCDELEKDAVEVLDLAIVLSPWLDKYGTDLVINTLGTVVVTGPDTNLTISEEAKNSTTYTSREEGTTHAAGEVITYNVAGGTSGGRYEVKFPFTTTDGQTLVVIQPFYVI